MILNHESDKNKARVHVSRLWLIFTLVEITSLLFKFLKLIKAVFRPARLGWMGCASIVFLQMSFIASFDHFMQLHMPYNKSFTHQEAMNNGNKAGTVRAFMKIEGKNKNKKQLTTI